MTVGDFFTKKKRSEAPSAAVIVPQGRLGTPAAERYREPSRDRSGEPPLAKKKCAVSCAKMIDIRDAFITHPGRFLSRFRRSGCHPRDVSLAKNWATGTFVPGQPQTPQTKTYFSSWGWWTAPQNSLRWLRRTWFRICKELHPSRGEALSSKLNPFGSDCTAAPFCKINKLSPWIRR